MECPDQWIIELTDHCKPAVFVEWDREKARRQFHMLVDSALDNGPVPSRITLLYDDNSGHRVAAASVQVEHRLRGVPEAQETDLGAV